MNIREATLDDNDSLIQLQEKCPQGTTVIVSTVNTPDFFARAKVYEDYKVFVDCEEDRIIASSACGLHKALINNKIEKVGYEFQAFVDPEYRGRRIAGQLQQKREEYIRKQGAILSYGLIMEGNKPSMRYIERRGFIRHDTLIMPSIAVFKEMSINDQGKIRVMTPDDLPVVSKLLNDTWQGYEFYEPMTGEDLNKLIERVPEYRIQDIYVLEKQGEITACLGFWDWSKVTQVTVNALSFKMKVISTLVNLAGIFFTVPPSPKPGNLLKQIVLTVIGYKDLSGFTTLLRFLNNKAYSEGIQQVFFICTRNHPILSSLKGFIHIDTLMHMNIKPLQTDISLGNKPVYVSGLDL